MTAVVLGILIGGRATRMGGIAKGLLEHRGKTLIAQAAQQFLLAYPQAEVVLLGSNDAYAQFNFAQLPDEPASCGPLGGLIALLNHAAERGSTAVLIGCDMPYLNAHLFSRLLSESPEANILAPRSTGKWETLCSRFRAEAVLVAARRRAHSGQHGLQGLFDAERALELSLTEGERASLGDWDTPEDAERGGVNTALPS
ncbi:MAG: hypothetical protein RJA70_2621 [Pseudomonadota bacterium]|jgi:molybdopterin-guanine dinucleotide biosynthesis protein A